MKKTLNALLCVAAISASAQPLPPNTPLISSGSVVITAQDFEAQMLRIPESARAETRASLDRVATMTDSLYVNRMLATEARASGFLDDPLVTLRGQQVLESYQARAYLDHLERTYKHVNIEQRARETYLADRKKYVQPATYEVEHILVSLWGRTKEMAIDRIGEARKKIVAGADFIEVAKEYTTDPSFKMNNGKLGTMQASQLDSEIGEVLPKLKDGEVSQPILTRAGYHLVRVTGRTAPRQLSFDDVKEALMEDERGRVNKRSVDERLQALRNRPDTRIDPEAMKKLVVDLPRSEVAAGRDPAPAAAAPKKAP